MGDTPLLIAAEKGHVDAARFLLKNGSNVSERNNVSRSKGICSHLMYYAVAKASLPDMCTASIYRYKQHRRTLSHYSDLCSAMAKAVCSTALCMHAKHSETILKGICAHLSFQH